MLGFDLETTGRDPRTARIVQSCTGWASAGDGRWESSVTLVNPGVPIPAEATEVHHITDADVAGEPRLVDILPGLIGQIEGAWAAGCPVIGFNVCYDLTVLDRECRRLFKRGLDTPGPVIDPYVLDKAIYRYRKGPKAHVLERACREWGVPLEGAHDAGNDAFATVRLAYKICRRGSIPKGPDLCDLTLGELFDYQREAYREQKLSYFDWLRGQGGTPDSWNTDWPVQSWQEEEEST
jgi:DNA polymerase III subunit epsilon